jgi:hypothetical protein
MRTQAQHKESWWEAHSPHLHPAGLEVSNLTWPPPNPLNLIDRVCLDPEGQTCGLLGEDFRASSAYQSSPHLMTNQTHVHRGQRTSPCS